MIEYSTIDKSDWDDGPWQSEPDKRQWTDEKTGLPCLIVRGPSGALCGYVGVDSAHPLYKVDYDDAYSKAGIEAHGGLTFASGCQDSADPSQGICHIPEPGKPDDVWWFGFDCAHSGDLCPAFSRDRGFGLFHDEQYRDIAYVEREVAALAQQLVAT
jgi:hypothetical protein